MKMVFTYVSITDLHNKHRTHNLLVTEFQVVSEEIIIHLHIIQPQRINQQP
jgi:hypothetical protein